VAIIRPEAALHELRVAERGREFRDHLDLLVCGRPRRVSLARRARRAENPVELAAA
jgi:hypothetical protein